MSVTQELQDWFDNGPGRFMSDSDAGRNDFAQLVDKVRVLELKVDAIDSDPACAAAERVNRVAQKLCGREARVDAALPLAVQLVAALE